MYFIIVTIERSGYLNCNFLLILKKDLDLYLMFILLEEPEIFLYRHFYTVRNIISQ